MERYCVGEICDIKDFQSIDRMDRKSPFFADYIRIASEVAGKDLTQFMGEDYIIASRENIVTGTIKGDGKKKDIYEDHTDIFGGKLGEVPLFEGADVYRVYRSMLGDYLPLRDGFDQCEMMDENKKAQVDEWRKKQSRLENFEFITALERCFMNIDYIYDILCDIYLTLLVSEDRKELLFFKINRQSGESPYSTADIDEGMENFIRNNKKKKTKPKTKPKRKDTIFDISGMRSTAKNTEVGSLGIGVKRLWLYEKDFRRLFMKTQKRFEKYDMKDIIRVIEQGAESGLVYGVDDYMILEKLLGMDICVHIHDTMEEMESPDLVVLEPLIEVLMEYDGIHSRQVFLSYIKRDLEMKRLRRLGFDEGEQIKTYTEILWDEVGLFNDRYKEVIDLYIREMQKKYTYMTVKKMIEDELIEIIMWKYEFQWEEEEKEEDKDQLGVTKNDKPQLHVLFRDVFERRSEQYASLIPTETMMKVQGQIIVKNRERYELRQRKG